jgi:transcriptional regulator with XRE-family HTH domain
MDRFGERISKLLGKKKMTQKELSKRIGCTEVTLVRYISGDRIPKADIIKKIAKELDTSADYLLDIKKELGYTEILHEVERIAPMLSKEQRTEIVMAVMESGCNAKTKESTENEK